MCQLNARRRSRNSLFKRPYAMAIYVKDKNPSCSEAIEGKDQNLLGSKAIQGQDTHPSCFKASRNSHSWLSWPVLLSENIALKATHKSEWFHNDKSKTCFHADCVRLATAIVSVSLPRNIRYALLSVYSSHAGLQTLAAASSRKSRTQIFPVDRTYIHWTTHWSSGH